MTCKQRVIDAILGVEGEDHTDHPDDSGGSTKWGVTETVARAYGYLGKMSEMPRQIAFDIYSRRYWDSVQGDSLATLSEAIAEEVVDTGVLMGPVTAIKFLQRALNVFNVKQTLYPDVAVDGVAGPATFRALAKYLTKRSEKTLCKALNCLQGAGCIELAEQREKDETFVYGWLNRRVNL
jgi:lysozyme family protein